MLRNTKKQREWLSSSSEYLSVSVLSRSLEAVKKFLEYLLSIQASQFRYITSIVWGRAVQVIVVLSRLSFPIPENPNWNSQAARDYAPLGMYLDCLCYRLQGVSKTVCVGSEIPGHPDAAFIFKTVFESLKDSYERRIIALNSSKDPAPALSTACDGIVASSNGSVGFISNCPIMNKSVAPHLDAWKASSNEVLLASAEMCSLGTAQKPTTMPVYHDIWATMTINWAME
jgi:hypothetical protein